MRSLPRFSLADYAALLRNLQRAGWTLAPVTAMATGADAHAHLRHDVDFSLRDALPMARSEADLGVHATYYVLLSGPYNALAADNRRVLRQLVAFGHEIGLHYDLATYPSEPKAAAARLAWEISVLEELTGMSVRTICLHQPSLTGTDPFRSGPLLHPHDPAHGEGLLYVSDSCRRWRDDALLNCFGSGRPRRLLLNTHPELWLDGTLDDPIVYLERVVARCLAEPAQAYLREVVRPLWSAADLRP